jgi:hypothetical protein
VAAGLVFQVIRGTGGSPRSQAALGYAALWIVVVGARIGFSYATSHSHQLQSWLFTRSITGGAITDAPIFMAAGMRVLRIAILHLPTTWLPGTVPSAQRFGRPAVAPAPSDL